MRRGRRSRAAITKASLAANTAVLRSIAAPAVGTAAEPLRATCTGPGTARTVVRDGATGDGVGVSDLNVILDTMGDLMAMSMATSSVRDGGSNCREGDHQDHEEGHFRGR